MKINKISNLLSFLCLGLFLILILLAYSLNKRILSLETELLSCKEKIKSIENRFNVENYKYLKNDKFLTDDNFKEFQKLIVDYVKKI